MAGLSIYSEIIPDNRDTDQPMSHKFFVVVALFYDVSLAKPDFV